MAKTMNIIKFITCFFLQNIGLFITVFMAFAAGYSTHRDFKEDYLFIIFLLSLSMFWGWGYKKGAFNLLEKDIQ
jgi:membrane protease YdiL (CAAX protease family)